MPLQSATKSTNSATSSAFPELSAEALGKMIDHTLLKADATQADIERICTEAVENGFKTVCVNSSQIAHAATALHQAAQVRHSAQGATPMDSSLPVPIAVVGFPLGAALTSAKVFEARESIRLGAREIDMVINLGALKDHQDALVQADIHEVVEASRPYGVKVILETCLLTDEQKVRGCLLAKAAGAAFVKTSTGFSTGGATAEDIALMRKSVGSEMGVKASGGIRTYDDAMKMIYSGASRLGVSASVAIVKQAAAGGKSIPAVETESSKSQY